jgi:hypothetical protein
MHNDPLGIVLVVMIVAALVVRTVLVELAAAGRPLCEAFAMIASLRSRFRCDACDTLCDRAEQAPEDTHEALCRACRRT